ncbi:MAG: recombinase family protein [Candidatus Binataceae bacterium]
MANPSPRRCAIYTRKSSEEGLEQDFNSLHAQREACEAFIKSQAGEGWRLIKTAYNDGGLSGGTMERPALQQLLSDIRQGLVDVVVVYKVDRLTRSLADFAKMVEVFDEHGVSFVAVTQQFNTTTSMGRLTLNVLLSFAQFEREVTGERIRDKIAASKKKGMWMGGTVPIGYDVRERRLVVNQAEASTVKEIYAHYLELGSIRLLKQDLDRRGIVSKVRVSKAGIQSGGKPFSRGALHELLSNPIYVGEVSHRKDRHLGLHEAIVDRELWDRVQRLLRGQAAHPRRWPTATVPSPLTGKLFDEAGEPLYVCGASKGGRRYRYYVSRSLIRNPAEQTKGGGWRLAAPEIERAVRSAAVQVLKDRSAIGTLLLDTGFSSLDLVRALESIDEHRAHLESERDSTAGVEGAINRIDLKKDGLQITLDLTPLLADQFDDRSGAHLTITRFVPLRLKRRGVELRIVIDGNVASASAVDLPLLKAIARGHRWFSELASNRARDTLEIAKREGLRASYVRRLIPYAFLAPSIVEAICEGHQPPDLTVERLRRRAGLPYQWAEQHKALGLGEP